jgi:hypothetical protein
VTSRLKAQSHLTSRLFDTADVGVIGTRCEEDAKPSWSLYLSLLES